MLYNKTMISSGYAYEKWCAGWLKRHGYRNVSITPASHDQGIDLIAEKKHSRIGFQCKYYDHPVGNKAVQEAYSGAAFYGCDKAAVLTNSSFTSSAEQLADDLHVKLMEHIQPEEVPHALHFKRAVSLYLLCISFSLFLYVSFHSRIPWRMPQAVISVCLFFSALSALCCDHLITPGIISVLLAVYPAAFYLIHKMRTGLGLIVIPLLFQCIAVCIGITFLMKQRNVWKAQKEREELRQESERNMHNLAEHIRQLAETELNSTLTIRKISCENGNYLFTFQCDRNIDEELPLLTYSLHQILTVDFEIEAVNRRQFSFKLLKQI